MNNIIIRSGDMEESCEEIKTLRKRFERHLDVYRIDASTSNEHQIESRIMQENTIKVVSDLTLAVQPLVDGITFLVVAQKLIKWTVGLAPLGIGIAWLAGLVPFK